MGYRVGIIDTNIQSPGIHLLFNLGEEEIEFTLNDYLCGNCSIDKATYDVTARLDAAVRGQLFLVPSSIKATEIALILREGYDVGQLRDGFEEMIQACALDILLLDTHSGLNEETLLALAISTTVLLTLCPDQQDYQGTAVMVEVARKLDVQELILLVNKVPQSLDIRALIARVGQRYQCEVSALLPYSEEMMALGSGDIFAVRYPTNQLTVSLTRLAKRLLEA